MLNVKKKKEKLFDEIIEKYMQPFAIFSFVANRDDRKMQSSFFIDVYACFACLMLVTIWSHYSTINIIIDCILTRNNSIEQKRLKTNNKDSLLIVQLLPT